MKKSIFVQALVFAWCLLQLVPGIATSGEAAHGNDEFSKCQNEKPGNTDVLIDLAIKYQEDSQYRKSNACARKVLRQEPDNAIANYIVGFTNLVCGILDDNNEAYFRKAIATDTSSIVSQKASQWLSLYSQPLPIRIERPKTKKKLKLESDWVKKTNGKVTHSRKKQFEQTIDEAVNSTVIREINSILKDHRIFSVDTGASGTGTYHISPVITINVKENSNFGVNLVNKTPLGLFRIIPGVSGALDDQADFDIEMDVTISINGPKLARNTVFESSEKLAKVNVQDVSSKISEVYSQKIKDLEFTLRKALLTGDTSRVPDEQVAIDTSDPSKSGAQTQDDSLAVNAPVSPNMSGTHLPVSKTQDNLAVNEVRRDGRFIAYSNGTVLDIQNHLMWAAEDNMSDIDWPIAKEYCEKYRGGGYTDWRLPTQDELAGLYDENKSQSIGGNPSAPNHIATDFISLSSFALWASETRGPTNAGFVFQSGRKTWARYMLGYRVLPVRSCRGTPDINIMNSTSAIEKVEDR